MSRHAGAAVVVALALACGDRSLPPAAPAPTSTVPVEIETMQPSPRRLVVDETFGEGGRMLFEIGEGEHELKGVLVSPDGGILVAGHAPTPDRHMVAARFTTEGAPYRLFGGSRGVAPVSPGGFGTLLALDAQGRVLVAGHVYTDSEGVNVLLGRLLHDGTLDSSFGTQGVISVDFGTSSEQPSGLFALPSGQILIAGRHSIRRGDDETFVARFDDRGALDPTFGAGGLALFDPLPDVEYTTRAVRDPSDGAIVVAGYVLRGLRGYAARLSASGEPDLDFGEGGVVVIDQQQITSVWALALEPITGKVLVGGHLHSNRSVVVRLDRKGALDPTWGDAGLALGAEGDDQYYALLPQPDGSVLGVGFRGGGDEAKPLLALHSATGSLAPTFGVDGVLLGPHAGDLLLGATIDEQGRVVGVGMSVRGRQIVGLVMRFAPL
jgi:uncharacterized delta-60 repeat protein